jgi:hypothetical protein
MNAETIQGGGSVIPVEDHLLELRAPHLLAGLVDVVAGGRQCKGGAGMRGDGSIA